MLFKDKLINITMPQLKIMFTFVNIEQNAQETSAKTNCFFLFYPKSIKTTEIWRLQRMGLQCRKQPVPFCMVSSLTQVHQSVQMSQGVFKLKHKRMSHVRIFPPVCVNKRLSFILCVSLEMSKQFQRNEKFSELYHTAAWKHRGNSWSPDRQARISCSPAWEKLALSSDSGLIKE